MDLEFEVKGQIKYNMKKIKVVHITTIDVGGAYKAVERILNATSKYENLESCILLRNKVNPVSEGEVFLNNGVKNIISKTKNVINAICFHKGEILADKLGSDVSGNKFVADADVIVIHWINSFLSMKSIEKLLGFHKPVVVMLHDMWHITGGCSYSGECKEYYKDCCECEYPMAHKAFLRKKRVYSAPNLFLVAPGTWVGECATNSGMNLNNKVSIIPNCVNTDIFSPIDKKLARNIIFGNDEIKKPVVLFTAMTAGQSNVRKGFDYLTKALGTFDENSICLLVIGNIDKEDLLEINQDIKYLGYISDEKELAMAYSSADVTVVPSLQETFCFTACESLSCGTPVAAFKTGGLEDQIVHRANGYLAKLKNSDDLAEGIKFCIYNSDKMHYCCREKALGYSYLHIGEAWNELFANLTNDTNGQDVL